MAICTYWGFYTLLTITILFIFVCVLLWLILHSTDFCCFLTWLRFTFLLFFVTSSECRSVFRSAGESIKSGSLTNK